MEKKVKTLFKAQPFQSLIISNKNIHKETHMAVSCDLHKMNFHIYILRERCE